MEHKIGRLKIKAHDDFLGKLLKSWKLYEEDFLKYSIPQVKEWTTIIDVGANIGNHTLFWLYKGFDVISFEPIVDNWDLLIYNVYNNKLYENWTGYNVWLWNKEWKMQFQIVNNNMWACRKSDIINGWTRIDVKTLDSYTTKKPISLIKIDVEGMELEVLEGALWIITKYRPDLMVEINNPETLEFLEGLGYRRTYWQLNNKNLYLKYNKLLWKL